jgi:arylamine N-acetyltransferase
MAGKYTKEQLEAYFDRIGIPKNDQKIDITDLDAKASLEYLKKLIKAHLTSVPFENLVSTSPQPAQITDLNLTPPEALHYSPHRTISLHPEELYQKIVVRKRGGYCMELNTTFSTLLRSIGYVLYHAGARVNASNTTQAFGPFDHMLNILTIGQDRYLIDVGFGSNYVPTVPVRLINDNTGFTNVAPASARLVFKAIEGNMNKNSKLWIYQHRINSEAGWKDLYCFNAELEFRGADFEMMNYWTSTSPKTIFTQKVICNKMVLGEDGEIVGTLGLMREVKNRVGAKSEVLKEFESEEERVEALKEYFEIVLSAVEKEAIRKTGDEIH